ncbi:phosphodiester glycosidase family protein [Cysteiniphilum halobium]|uniref:phosphodiester glycosidase family protein n=1 Tax=Cysteiniphilum halobium TaxID=2219059 RepID=UPI000E64A302|nr:phosphodiester glycosidase family protein [Cysteiniphilum halobium]
MSLQRILSLGLLLSIAMMSFATPWQLQQKKSVDIVPEKVHFYNFGAFKKKHFPLVIDVVLLDNGSYKAGLTIQSQNNIQSVLDIATQKDAFLATNGGFYQEGFLVNGLLIDQSKLRLPLVNNTLLSSIITIDQRGQVNILDKNQKYHNAYYAFQVGPILLKDNLVQKVDDNKIAKRIVYAQTSSKLMVIYIDSTTLQQAAYIVKALASYFKINIKRAVNFDGGKAGAFILRKYVTPVIYPEYSSVKSIIYFILKEK